MQIRIARGRKHLKRLAGLGLHLAPDRVITKHAEHGHRLPMICSTLFVVLLNWIGSR